MRMATYEDGTGPISGASGRLVGYAAAGSARFIMMSLLILIIHCHS